MSKKTFYSEYALHCLRYYAKHRTPHFTADSDRLNWMACNSAFSQFSLKERDLLFQMCSGGGNISSRIRDTSEVAGIPTDALWSLLHSAEYHVAKARELL